MAAHALKARYVFPVSSQPIAEGMVGIVDQRIADVGRQIAADTVQDLGNVAILPGLVNAHTHLEFSDLRQPLGQPGMGFVDWIRLIRRESLGVRIQTVKNGLNECAHCGVTTIGEIAQPDLPEPLAEEQTAGGTAFLELIAPTAARIAAALELAEIRLKVGCAKHTPKKPPTWQVGLSPHAPYSVHKDLLEKVIILSDQHRIPLAMHLAESREELQWLADGTGPLKDLLIELGAYDPMDVPRGPRALDYLRLLAKAHRALVVHGNYLGDEEIALLADHAENMAVAFCPRTHDFFGHDRYPLEKMLAAGVRICLGTDSRASTPDLDLLAEMRFVARRYAQVSPTIVMKLGTLQGAKALGRDGEIGTLEPGKYANLAIVPLPDREAADPHELLFDSDKPVAATWFRGKQVYG